MNNNQNNNQWQGNNQGYYAGQQPVYGQYPTVEEEKKSFFSNPKKAAAVLVPLVIVTVAFATFVFGGFFSKKPEATQVASSTVVTESTTQSVVYTETTPVSTDPAIIFTQESQTQPTTVFTTESTTVFVTESTTQPTTVPTTEPTTVVTEPTKEEILKAVSDGISSLKDPSACFKGKKTQVIDLKLTDCSVAAMVEPINTILEYFAGEEVFEFDFTNGKAIDPETGKEISSAAAIPPTDKPFVLTVDGVADAKYEQVGEDKVYTITVVPESSNLASPRPPHHNAACDTLDFSAFELPVGEVTKADFEYPGAVITVTIGADGRIKEYHENLPMSGTGEGKLGITAGGSMEGYIDEKWVIEWK